MRVSCCLLALSALVPLASVAEPDAAETPSMELLEFLAEWETQDGEWVDPLQLLEELKAESQNVQVEDQSNE